MFDHHRKSPWFAEKYDPAPEFQNLRTRVRKEGWRGRVDAFVHDLESGKYDPDLTEPEEIPSSPVKETLANGDNATAESNGAASAPPEDANKAAGDDEMQFNVEVDEEAVDNEPSRHDTNGKASSDRRSGRGEEMSVPPEGNQVMIRTIPPDIGRVKLEEVCIIGMSCFASSTDLGVQACGKIPGFVYLALGDPLQKRNYYRAGWLKFSDEADMTLVMSELADKKVSRLVGTLCASLTSKIRSKASSCMLRITNARLSTKSGTHLRLRAGLSGYRRILPPLKSWLLDLKNKLPGYANSNPLVPEPTV